MVVFVFGVWAYESLKSRKLVVQKNQLGLAMVVFAVAVGISFGLSQDKVLSTYGYFGRFMNSLPFYLVIVALFIGLSNILSGKLQYRKLVGGLVTGLNLLGLFVLVQHFGIVPSGLSDKFAFFANPSFNTMGSAVLIPFVLALNLSLAAFLYKLSEEKSSIYYFLVTILVSTFTFAVTAGAPNVGQNWMYYAFLGMVVVLTALSNKDDAKRNKLFLVSLIVCLLVSLLVTNVNPFKSALKLDTDPYVRESTLGFGFSWQIMGETLAESPSRALFGSGPDTFIEDFSRYKPLEYNSTSFWSVRLSRGGGELMEMLSNLGLIPVFAFLGVLFVAGKMGYKSFKAVGPYSSEMKFLFAVLLSIVLLGIFFVWNTVIWFILLLVLVGIVIFDRMNMLQDSEVTLSLNLASVDGGRKDYLPAIFAVSVLLLSLVSVNFLVRSCFADYQYKESVKLSAEEKNEEALNAAIRSVQYCDKKDYLHRQVALQSLILLEQISAEDEPDQDSQSAFLSQVIRETEKLLSTAPRNVENWETASIIYQRLINLTDGQYGTESVNALKNAILLDPNKPQLYEALGVLYERAEEYDTAKQQIEYAINLLPGYFHPYLTLAEVYESEDDLKTSIQLLDAAKKLLPEDSEIIPLIDKKIESLEKGETSTTETMKDGSVENIVDESEGPVEEYPEDNSVSNVEETAEDGAVVE